MAIKLIALIVLLAQSCFGLGHFYQTVDPAVVVWKNNLIAAGSNCDGYTLWAVNRLSAGIKEFGLRLDMYAVNPRAGTNLAGSFIRLIVPLGTNISELNSNFDEGDYVEKGTNGGITGNGVDEYSNTWISPASLGVAQNEFSLWIAILNTNLGTIDEYFIGSQDGSSLCNIVWKPTPLLTGQLFITSHITQGTNTQQIAFVGLNISDATEDSNYHLWINSIPMPSDGGSSVPPNNVNIYFAALNFNGTGYFPSSHRLGSTVIAKGLSKFKSKRMGELGYLYERMMGRLR